MVEINKNHVRVKKRDGGFRVNVPAWKCKELDLEHNDLLDFSNVKKVVEKNQPPY